MAVFDEYYFKTLFYKNYDRVFTGFLQKTKSDEVAQDLSQITFIKLWEYRHNFNFEIPVELQINRKAKLVFIDWLRKEAHQRKLIKEIGSFGASELNRNQFELTDLLKSAIDYLPPIRKTVFQLSYVEGYSRQEIADKLEISIKTVDSHIFKALKQLRKTLTFFIVHSIIFS